MAGSGNNATKMLHDFMRTATKAKASIKRSGNDSKVTNDAFDSVIDKLEDLFEIMDKGQEGTRSNLEKSQMRDLTNVTTSLLAILRSKDKSINVLQDTLADFQESTLRLAETLGGDKRMDDAKDINAKMLKEIQGGLAQDIAKAFAESQDKISRGSAVARKGGVYGTLANGLAGGLLGSVGLGAAGKDVAELLGLDDKIEKLFMKTAGHWSRKRKRAGMAGVEGLSSTSAFGTDALSNKQNKAKSALAADNASDFMRESVASNKNVVRTLKGLKSGFSLGGMGSLFSTFLGGGSTIVKILGGIGSALMGLMGLKSMIPGGVDLPGGMDLPGGSGLPGGGPKGGGPKGAGRLGKFFKGAKSLGGKGLARLGSLGARALPWLGRAGMSLVSSPGAMVAGAGLAGYGAGSYLNDKFDLSGKIAGAAMDATPGVEQAWESAKSFLSGGETVADIIKKASQRTGVDFGTMMAFAKQESGFNPNAKAKSSSASGLFQFIGSTWKTMVSKYGKTFGIGEKDIMDPLSNATMGALYIKENSSFLRKNGIPVNGTTLYASHFLGPGGAAKLFAADPNADASKVLPDAAGSNPGIFKKKDGGSKTIAEVQQTLFDKVGKNVDAFAAHANAQGASISPPSVARSKGGDNMPQVAAAATPLAVPPSTSNTGANGAPGATIDDIPMYVNDMGLVLTTAGALI